MNQQHPFRMASFPGRQVQSELKLYLAQASRFCYAHLIILIERGTLAYELSPLCYNYDQETSKENQTGLRDVLLSQVVNIHSTSEPAPLLVVLQKLEEKKWGVEWSSQACLDGYAEQFDDQRDLPSYISFCQSSQLPFSHHVHHLKTRYRFAMPSQRRKSPFQALSSV